jgi:predicted alpha/beta superfamily hydrolase
LIEFSNRTLAQFPTFGRLVGRLMGRSRRSEDDHAWQERIIPLGPFPPLFLASPRTAVLYLPPGYDGKRKEPYPLLLLQDGQNLFFPELSFAGEAWNVGRTADHLIRSGIIEPLMIAGIDNGGLERIDEYTPTRDSRHQSGGGADRYEQFLFQQLIPTIEQLTNLAEARLAIGGSSLGALLALTLALREPFPFRAVAALSPSVWWDGKWLLKTVKALPGRPPLTIWLDIGTNEGADAVQGTRLLRDALLRKGLRKNHELFYREFRGAEHHERAWGQRFDSVLRALFPRR